MTDKNLNLINQETAVKSYSADLGGGVRLDGEEDFVVVISSFVLCLKKSCASTSLLTIQRDV